MNGHAQRMSEIAAYLRGRKDGDYMDKDAAIHCEQAMHELIRQDARIAALEALLGEAIESIEDWAGYASEYFREKYGLAEELAKFRAALGEP